MTDNQLADELLGAAQRRLGDASLTHRIDLPAAPARFGPWPQWVLPELREKLEKREVTRLWTHQSETAELAWSGRDVVVATSTSSGKSLGYQLPVLTRLAASPAACALYLTPTKALGSDQLLAVQDLLRGIDALDGVFAAPYDGDTPVDARRTIRDRSRFVFSNPDMVHAAILASHQRWARLLRHLDYLIIDECHSYRGVFGAHVALVVRRLLRIAARYGSHPTVILASATSADPADAARRLTGRDVTAVTDDGSPTGVRTVALWEPGFLDGVTGDNGAPVRRSALSDAAGISACALAEGARVLTFVRSRAGAEVTALRTQEELGLLGRADIGARVASYRAGYLAEDRRALERALDDGRLLGLATTNALEMGIDVGGLDCVVTAGFPGTVASFWQQAGRAGRRGQGCLVVMVARDDPMDTYLVHHPEALVGRPVEKSVFNPHNPVIARGHVYCAAVEAPLSAEDVAALGAESIVDDLVADGLLRRRPHGWFAAPGRDDAHAAVTLRGGSGEEVAIVDVTDGRLLGTIDSARALSQVHEQAVYLHQGASYVVDALDLDEHVAFVHPDQPEYSTRALSTTDIRILSDAAAEDRLVNYGPGLWVANVDVEVTTRTTGYQVRLADGTVADTVALDVPATRLVTRAVAYTVDPLVLDAAGISAGEVPGALHAAEHAAIGLLPLIATCDRWDIGGVSTALHQDTNLPTVFVYDGHPGGAGFADEGFARFPEWIASTYDAVRACACEAGCPSCVQSPKCGNGNSPLDKAAAVRLLGALVTLSAA
ncbi:DEAD/DEAH box helicase [Corynebacterium uterequi]|uniref:Helicase/secretion neighborhood putative DEAH-box helicase n=1 Tax=Corynebacterium uterequi TaxID=1072256 RepID=A0A0G3HBZ2_9CORY|nr:DEAD/DEAH box helicase [Corynebacterium uterequi]AKK10205.1 helicase/secretion neighborhood putative DEAH-box helicase [Corynebacterium uterequi]